MNGVRPRRGVLGKRTAGKRSPRTPQRQTARDERTPFLVFQATLPELLADHEGEWVAFTVNGPERFAPDEGSLYAYYRDELKCDPDAYYIGRIEPPPPAPVVTAHWFGPH